MLAADPTAGPGTLLSGRADICCRKVFEFKAWSQICAGPRPGRDSGRGRPKRERDQFAEEEGEVPTSDIGSRQKKGPGSASPRPADL